jgi:uncharacterized protein (UPF0276 family)
MATYQETEARYLNYQKQHGETSKYLVTQFKKYIASGNAQFLQEKLNSDSTFLLSEINIDHWNKESIQETIVLNMESQPYNFFNKHYSTATNEEISVFPEDTLQRFAEHILNQKTDEIQFVDGLINSSLPYVIKEKLIINNVTKYLGPVNEIFFQPSTLKKIADAYADNIGKRRMHRPSMMLNPALTDKQFVLILDYILEKEGYADNLLVPEEKWHLIEQAMLKKQLSLHTALAYCAPSERILHKHKIVALKYDIESPIFVDFYYQEAINQNHADGEKHVKKYMRRLINNIRSEEDFLKTYLLLQNWETYIPKLHIAASYKKEFLNLITNKPHCPSKIIALHGNSISSVGLKILQQDKTLQAIYVCSVSASLFPYYDDQKRFEFIKENAYLVKAFGRLPIHWVIDILKLKANEEFHNIQTSYKLTDDELKRYGVLVEGMLNVTYI